MVGPPSRELGWVAGEPISRSEQSSIRGLLVLRQSERLDWRWRKLFPPDGLASDNPLCVALTVSRSMTCEALWIGLLLAGARFKVG